MPVGADFSVPLLSVTDNGTSTVLSLASVPSHVPFTTLKVTFATSTVGSPIFSLSMVLDAPSGSLYFRFTSLFVGIFVPDTNGLTVIVWVCEVSVISPIFQIYLPVLFSSFSMPFEQSITSNFSRLTISTITASVPAGLELICSAHNFKISLNCLA